MTALKSPLIPAKSSSTSFWRPRGSARTGLRTRSAFRLTRIRRDRLRRAQHYRRHRVPRLRRSSDLSEGYFLRLQNTFDMLEVKRRSAKAIAKIKPFKAIAA